MLRALFGTVILVLFTTCTASQNTSVQWECPSTSEPLLETVTFNAGLAPGVVPHATPRTQRVAEEIGKLRGVGLICLQEVWEPDARDRVLRELNLPEENVYHVETFGEGESEDSYTCKPKYLRPLMRCTERKCADYPDEDKSICTKQRCFLNLAKVYLEDKECIHCLLSMVGHAPQDIFQACTSDKGRGRTYNGSNGTILASRWPLKNREVIRLPSSGVNRVALLATVDVPGMGEIEVGCTHLSSETIMDPIYPGFRKWADEMIAQFNLAEKRMRERANGKPQLFLGDFNAGPGRDGYGASSWPPIHRGVAVRRSATRVWRHIRKSGFTSAVTRVKPTFCTTCSDNELRGRGKNHLIDHILLRNPEVGLELEAVCAHPWFDSPVRAVTTEGKSTKVNLSDHYGSVVKYRKK